MKIHITLSLLFLSSIFCFGQIKESAQVDSIFSEWNRTDVPGAALGIVHDGELIYAKGYGLGDLEHDLVLTPSSVFYIGSVSKQFVTFCILLLEEQGKLALDDEIQKYLPDFPQYESPLTIRHFIHHTSGVRDYLTLMYLKGRNYLDNTDVDEVYELIKKQKELNFTPGERYLYSNSCYFMLAMIIEKSSGQTIKNFAHEQIFKPLGMNSTLFYDDNTDLIKNRVFSYEKKDVGEGFNNLISRFDLVGSGGIYSNIEDLYLWDQNFYKNVLGIGTQDIIEKMHTEGLLNNGESSGYAFALNNGTYKGLKTVSHGGALAGYRAQLMRFPEQQFSVIILANRGDANPTSKAYRVVDILLKEQFIEDDQKSVAQDDRLDSLEPSTVYNQSQLAGKYEIQPGMLLEISEKDDSLHVIQSWNKNEYNIYKTRGNKYEISRDASVQFIFSKLEDDLTQVLTVFQNGNETVCKRKKDVDLSEVNLEEFVGSYYSEEIDASYRLYLEEGILKISVGSIDPLELENFDIDQFISDGNVARFSRENGQVDGFELDAGRVKNLKFKKR